MRLLWSPSRPDSDIPTSESSKRMPTVTCAPWKPVSTKKLLPKRSTPASAPRRRTRELVDLAADEDIPSNAVASSQIRIAGVVALDGGQRQHHRQRGHEQDEGADRRVGDVVDLVRRRARRARFR